MTDIRLPPHVLNRISRKGRSLNPFTDIDPKRTAHLVVDMQHGFVEAGASGLSTACEAMVPRINAISAALRAHGGLVVYLLQTVDEETLAGWSNNYGRLYSEDAQREIAELLVPGRPGHAVWRGMDVQPQDLQLIKRRFSAFIPGSSELHAVLQARGIDTVIVTGTVSNVCCEATARDAMMLNYRVLFITDGNAAIHPDDHDATLAALAGRFAGLTDAAGMVALIEG